MEQALGQTGVVITVMVVTCKNPMEYDCPRKVSPKRQVLYGGRIGRSWASVMQMNSLGQKGTLDTISKPAFLLHFTYSSELHHTS